MYLTGGQFKGIKIEMPNSARPTLSKVRESVFNILFQYDTKENKFLDMFAGSGLMGLEALSRGYKVKELEINPKSAAIIKKNYKKINIEPDITICNSLKYKDEKFNVIYLDPPWDMDYRPVIKKACELLEKEGIIVVEHDLKKELNLKDIIDKECLKLEIIKSKRYGRCLIDLLLLC